MALQLSSGAAFISSTPEQLYMRSGSAVASEAVAGTRPRGPVGTPYTLASDGLGRILFS